MKKSAGTGNQNGTTRKCVVWNSSVRNCEIPICMNQKKSYVRLMYVKSYRTINEDDLIPSSNVCLCPKAYNFTVIQMCLIKYMSSTFTPPASRCTIFQSNFFLSCSGNQYGDCYSPLSNFLYMDTINTRPVGQVST